MEEHGHGGGQPHARVSLEAYAYHNAVEERMNEDTGKGDGAYRMDMALALLAGMDGYGMFEDIEGDHGKEYYRERIRGEQ